MALCFSFSMAWGQITTFGYTGSLQTYTVPLGVTSIRIECSGAQGGSGNGGPGGLGATMIGTFAVTPGEVLDVIVGERGLQYGNSGAGGAGSGVTDAAGDPMIVAGGGGGGATNEAGKPGLTTTTGGSSSGSGGAGGNGGQKGFRSGDCGWAAGGGGFYGNGYGGNGSWDGGGFPGTLGVNGAGMSWASGGAGGVNGGCTFTYPNEGTWGCGGGGAGSYGGAGGGGYSGGAGGQYVDIGGRRGGGGGGSFNGGTDQVNTAGANAGFGEVIIEVLCTGLVTSVSATEVCEGDEVTLEASSTTGGTTTWDGGVTDGVAFEPPLGVTTYTATSTSPDDCDFQVDITVNETPDVTLSVTATEMCDDEEIIFTGGGADTYTYDPADVTDGMPYTPAALGTATYTVTGVITATGCENTATVDVTMNPTPSVTATASETEICRFEEVTFTEAGDADTYTWDPAGIVSGVPFTDLPEGTIDVVLTGTFDATGCDTEDIVTVIVNPSPYVNATSGDENYCDGETVVLGAGGDADVWVWDPTDLEPGIGTHTYTLTGTYDGGICETTDEVTITVHANPTVTASADNEEVCVGNDVTLNGGGAESYMWDMGVMDGMPFDPGMPGTTTYTVTGTDANGCTDEATIDVTVTEEISITYVVTPETVFEDGEIDITVTGGVAPYTFDWDNDGTGDFDDTEDLTGLADALYTVVVNGSTGCSATEKIVVSTQASVGEFDQKAIAIYPNPTVDMITIEFEGTFVYELTDINGAIIAHATATDKEQVSMENVASGVYFVVIKANDTVQTVKVVKQ